MNTIFKREFRGLFLGATGWFCLIAPVFAAGVLTTVNNLLSLSSDASRMFPILCDLLILICLSRSAILGGKYLAMFALLGICAVYFALFPLLLGIWGNVSYGTAYASLLGWLLIAAAMLAVSFAVATRVRNRLLAVLFGVLSGVVIYFLPLLAALISVFPWVGILFLSLIGAGIAAPGVVRAVRQSRVPLKGILIFVPVCAVAAVLFFVAKPFYTTVLPNALDFLSIFGRLDGFRNGHLDLGAVLFLLSVTAVCLALAVLLPDAKCLRTGKGGGSDAKSK